MVKICCSQIYYVLYQLSKVSVDGGVGDNVVPCPVRDNRVDPASDDDAVEEVRRELAPDDDEGGHDEDDEAGDDHVREREGFFPLFLSSFSFSRPQFTAFVANGENSEHILIYYITAVSAGLC